MKKFLLLLLFTASAHAQITYQPFSLDTFSGMVDVVAPDKLKDQFSPDCLNVITDELGCLTKRTGYREFNGTALGGLQSTKRLYNYKKTDGTNYLIANSSHTMFANTSGGNSLSAIKGGLGADWVDDYTTANDVLIRCNGYSDYGGEWDGTTYTPFTVSNSTLPTAGKYIEFWHNRYWVCGSSINPNVLFYSEINDPKDIEPYNYINVSKNDGDSITGLIKWADRLLVTKSYETFEVLENSGGSFILRLVSPKIGCLYSGTYDELDGLPIWLSARGVERFDGANFELLSAPIDNMVKVLPQLVSSVGSNVWDTAADWGAGSGVRIDTTSSSGNVKMDLTGNTYYERNTKTTDLVSTWANSSLSSQTFWVNGGGAYYVGSIGYYDVTETGFVNIILDVPAVYEIGIKTLGEVLVASATLTADSIYSSDLRTVNINCSLTGKSTYYFYMKHVSGDGLSIGCSTNTYSQGRGFANEDCDLYFYVSYGKSLYSQYQSSVFSATGAVNWVNLNLTQTIPAGTSLQWYISPATAAALCTTTNIFPVNSPAYNIVMSSPVPYIMLFASMSTTNIGATPTIDKAVLSYVKATFGAPNQEPCGVTYQQRYYLFVSTDLSSNINNVALVYQKDGSWTRFNDIFVRSACIYLGKLYTGDSQDTGKIYETFVDDLYSDRGLGYESYWKSKYFNMGSYFLEKLYADLWVISDGAEDGFSIDYALDGYDTWWTLNVVLGGGVDVQRLPFPHATKGRLIQYKVYNNTAGENFSLKQLDTIYGGLAPR